MTWTHIPATEHHGHYIEDDTGQTVCDLYHLSMSHDPDDARYFNHHNAAEHAPMITAAPAMFELLKRAMMDTGEFEVQLADDIKELLDTIKPPCPACDGIGYTIEITIDGTYQYECDECKPQEDIWTDPEESCGMVLEPPVVSTTPCRIEQQSDEFFCAGCGKRWAVDEDRPSCRIDEIDHQIMMIEMTGRITGRERSRYQALKAERRTLTND